MQAHRRQASPRLRCADLACVAAGFADGFFESGLSISGRGCRFSAGQQPVVLVGNFTRVKLTPWNNAKLWRQPTHHGSLIPVLSRFSKFATAGEKPAVRPGCQDWRIRSPAEEGCRGGSRKRPEERQNKNKAAPHDCGPNFGGTFMRQAARAISTP